MANGWSCNGTRFRMRGKIDVLFNEAKPRGGGGGAKPYHCRSKPLAICVVQHLEYQRNRRRLMRISYLGWVKFHNFSSSWLNIASARSKRNAYFIHKTISVRDKTAQSYCDIIIRAAELRMVRNCTKAVQWYAASQWLSSHRRVHNKLSRCCTIRNVKYSSLWDNLGMSDINSTSASQEWYICLLCYTILYYTILKYNIIYYTRMSPQKITIGLSASITSKVLNESN